jgi:hypothetical protein
VRPDLGITLGANLWVHGSDIAWRYFDLGASFIWAVSGALLAAGRGYDLTGIYAIALVSSTGGGLLRDGLFLQEGPPAFHLGLTLLLAVDPRLAAPFTIALVALLRVGAVRYGFKTHAARGFLPPPSSAPSGTIRR